MKKAGRKHTFSQPLKFLEVDYPQYCVNLDYSMSQYQYNSRNYTVKKCYDTMAGADYYYPENLYSEEIVIDHDCHSDDYSALPRPI